MRKEKLLKRDPVVQHMQKLRVFILVLIVISPSCMRKSPRVLLYIEDSQQLSYMIPHEVNKMKEELNLNGFKVITATLSGETLKTDSITLEPDTRLSDVNVNEYEGFMLPCMASDTVISKEEISFIKNIVGNGKPLAAQVGAVQILARAGVLKGKKFAYCDEKADNPGMYPEFNGGDFRGNGVIQDGTIITSGTCPWCANLNGHKDGTEELTKRLIDLIRSSE